LFSFVRKFGPSSPRHSYGAVLSHKKLKSKRGVANASFSLANRICPRHVMALSFDS
jgi:hypothetical protein